MPSRFDTAKEFVKAWADYDSSLMGAIQSAKMGATSMTLMSIVSIENNLGEGTDARRQLAFQLALAEFSK